MKNWLEIWEHYFFFEEDGVEGSEAKGGLITEQILFTNFENRNG